MRVFCLSLLWLTFPVLAIAGASPAPKWIWSDAETPRAKQVTLRKAVEVRGEILEAELTGVAEFCRAAISINGISVADVEAYSPRFRFDVTDRLVGGENRITVHAESHSGPPAVALRLGIRFRDGTEQFVITDGTWPGAVELGELAPEPWGDHPDTVTIQPRDDYTQWKQALGSDAGTDPASFFVPEGFRIELLRSARPEEGSWVSAEFDPEGRLIIAREDVGLLRLTFRDDEVSRVETVNDTLQECRGLLFAHGALYAQANNSKGLHRLRDTNGDDRLDEVKILLRTEGGVGHGRNDLALGPDGRIRAIHGDSVELPAGVPTLMSPLRGTRPRGGHGFVLSIGPDGEHPEVVAAGMRNPFGIDFNADGEMFTYDADAEFDTGSPWYRPTRILHIAPGADFGWRAVTGSWPPYYPDNPEAAPPALDIGKGSPTAVKFGTGSKFPPKYRRALFVLDWAYGRVLAVHMTPRGAGYAMRAETFLKGRPFNATDLTFGPDGAMHVVTGGRETQSGLYRISYVGEPVTEPPPTVQQAARRQFSAEARRIRRGLESGKTDPWPHLDSPDPFLRHAARSAVERQPSRQWRDRALAEGRPLAALTALLALAQDCPADDFDDIVNRLGEFPLKELPVGQQVIALRVFEIVLSRNDRPDAGLAARSLKTLDPLYPAAAGSANERLAALLVRLNAPGVVPRTLTLLDRAETQRERFHYLHVLREARDGWTADGRERYFGWLARMPEFVGGEGMPTFIAKLRADAVASLPEVERERFASLLQPTGSAIVIPAEAKGRPFVRNWTVGDLVDSLGEVGRDRDHARGRRMFRAAACSACHRVGSDGAAVGPDLTSLANRFSRRDILESIVNPDKVVAEQYRRDVIGTADGRLIVGTIAPGGDYRSPDLRLMTNPLEPSDITTVVKKDIESHTKSETSAMPRGLLDTLTEDEILDLLAFVEAGGDPGHPAFRK